MSVLSSDLQLVIVDLQMAYKMKEAMKQNVWIDSRRLSERIWVVELLHRI